MRPVLNELRAADQAVDLVALVQQQLGEVRAVLPGDARDERALRHVMTRSEYSSSLSMESR